jgi:hypothetical protein
MSVHSQLGGGGGGGGFGVWGGGGAQVPYPKTPIRNTRCAGATSPHNHVALEQLLLTIMLHQSNFSSQSCCVGAILTSSAATLLATCRALPTWTTTSTPSTSMRLTCGHVQRDAWTPCPSARRRPYLTWTPSQASAVVQTQHSL